ncbi:hypothetical protein ZWY2020_059590 [Hordeum vulgare]|nr:hypothetical protein ZWY2020_059590 [Hordeum vulgare]
MNYEQSFIQAYAGEGWKGQSLEKIRPEKELERAKAEILRCKLRIREAFRNMDSLLLEGKLDESLFDSEGEISSEDIFCAICASKHVTLKNDIILCDGVCDRGFHQKCLNPPLLAEDIPQGDEGWLCPACDCKLDCIDLLNELQGSTLAIHDSWEEVFPESTSNGLEQIGASDLPSDDSEEDYDPTLAERGMEDGNKSSAEDVDEGSDSDDLDFITSSDESEPSKKKKSESNNKNTVNDLELPSDDSEDDDFDPEGRNSSEDQKAKTNSDESDFTSDSDDFCAEISKSCGKDEVLAPSFADPTDGVDIMEAELEQDSVLPSSSRRQVGRLNYKKLYDEAYGKETTDSAMKKSGLDIAHAQMEIQKTVIQIHLLKLKAYFEKEPYPSRPAKKHSSLFKSYWCQKERPENYTAENNDGIAADNIQQREPSGSVLEKPTVGRNGIVSEERMTQNNLDEGEKDISEQTLDMTPTANKHNTTKNSRGVDSPIGAPGGNQQSGTSRMQKIYKILDSLESLIGYTLNLKYFIGSSTKGLSWV